MCYPVQQVQVVQDKKKILFFCVIFLPVLFTTHANDLDDLVVRDTILDRRYVFLPLFSMHVQMYVV